MTSVARWWSINLTFTNLASASLLLVVGVVLGVVLASGSARIHTLALALVVGVPLALIGLFKPWLGIASCFATAPFLLYIKRFSWDTEVGLLVEASLALTLVAMLLQVSFGQQWRVWGTWLAAIVLVYAFYQLLQVFNPNTPSLFHRIFGVRAILTYVVPFLAALYVIRTRRALRFALWLWLGCSVIVGLYGLWQHFVGLNTYERWWIYANAVTHVLPGGRLRIFSTLGSADAFGMYMAIGVLFCLVVVVWTPSALQRLMLLATVPVMLLGLLYSLTRGAYAGFFAALVVLALLTRSKAYAVSLVILLLLGGLYGAANPEDYLVSRVTTTFNPTEDASYVARADALEDAWPIIANLPFGLGPATAGRKGGELLQRADVAAESARFVGVPLDNYFFRIGLENGWIGLALFVALLTVVLAAGTRITARLRDPRLRWVGAAIIASDVAMIIGAVSNNYFAYLPLNIFFWFTIGVLARLPDLDREPPEPPPAEEAGVEAPPARPVATSRLRPRSA